MSISLEFPESVLEAIAERAAAKVRHDVTDLSEPWLNVERAAAHLGISTSQLYTLCSQRHRNGLPVTKEGSRSYFKASALDAWRTR